MKVTLKKILKLAQAGSYAVGHFNTNNLETSQAILQAAVKEQAPVIIAFSESGLSYGGSELVKATENIIDRIKVPVVLHLDHGRSIELVSQAIPLGFSSVMIDASAFSIERNTELTKRVVRLAAKHGLSVEAEIGTIGGQEDKVKGSTIIYPTPKEVANFARQTKVDALAVGLGTSHGLPVPHEHVEQVLLSEIAATTKVPLVLHGASNLTPKTIRAAIRRGITKINIDTEIRQAFTGAVREELKDKSIYDLRIYLGSAREAVEEEVKVKIRLFGSRYKAIS